MSDIVDTLSDYIRAGFDPHNQMKEARTEIERLREHIYKQQLDIIMLGQEVGRLREERPQIDYVIDSHGVTHRSFTLVYKTRAARAEKEER